MCIGDNSRPSEEDKCISVSLDEILVDQVLAKGDEEAIGPVEAE